MPKPLIISISALLIKFGDPVSLFCTALFQESEPDTSVPETDSAICIYLKNVSPAGEPAVSQPLATNSNAGENCSGTPDVEAVLFSSLNPTVVPVPTAFVFKISIL